MIDMNLSSKHRINVICAPISKEIQRVDKAIKELLIDMDLITGKKYNYRSKNHITKRIRQAMILLPVKSLNINNDKVLEDKIITFAAAVEIVFNAIRLHDDISELSVLSGDMLQTIALLVGLDIFSKDLLLELTKMIEKSCYRRISDELEKSEDKYKDKESYIKSVRNKTGELMGTFVKLGVYLSRINENDTEAIIFKNYGYNIGMALHIMDDTINNRREKLSFEVLPLIKPFAEDAARSVKGLKESPYKNNLLKLTDYFIDFSQNKIARTDIY